MATQFLLLSVPENLRPGGSAKVIAAARDEEGLTAKLQGLDASVLGRVAMVEVRQLFERRPAVNNVPVDDNTVIDVEA